MEKFKIDYTDPRYQGLSKSKIKKMAKKEYWDKNKQAYRQFKKEKKKLKKKEKAETVKTKEPEKIEEVKDVNKINKREHIEQQREKQKSQSIVIIDSKFEETSTDKVY